ncbi:galactose-1-phosphate uridylyltransferase [Micromonospora sp. NPDC047527]|uniref:galactose-1-phosphate uridylyltransferase n=1 Tax=Micromonospora sp. NPDC047527 TaxID=3155144 RepID=UPI00340E68F4
MRQTHARLADGREIIYFDESSNYARVSSDVRVLPARATPGHTRVDPLTGEVVIMAPHRRHRGVRPGTEQCPLCPSTPFRLTEVPESDYEVVVFENRFASLGTRCEVVSYSPSHTESFGTLTSRRARLVVNVLADRTDALAAMPGVEQVFCFEDRGAEIGVTLDHPHGQIYAYPFIPGRSQLMLDTARRYAETTGRPLLGDLVRTERERGELLVAAGQHWTAFVPPAARWPFEILLVPHRQVPDLRSLTDPELDEFCAMYQNVLHRLDRIFGIAMPYVSAWHQAPVRALREYGYLHLQLISIRSGAERLKYLGGSELAMGAFVNEVLPAEAASMLRHAGPGHQRTTDHGSSASRSPTQPS